MKASLGVDFGTESARALLLDVANGKELAIARYEYPHGVIRGHLPGTVSDVRLGAGWALQNPGDYFEALRHTVPQVLQTSGVAVEDVIGIGIDFTSCTMLPTTADGTPLCALDEYRREPHSWVKLWAHHAAQSEADQITRVAVDRAEPWLERFGGRISSESFFPKCLQILHEAPDVYEAAGRLIDAADWLVWRLTGAEVRGAGTAGYKALWDDQAGFPSPEFFAAVDRGFRDVVETKMSRDIRPLGDRAGRLSEEGSRMTGLISGTPVAVPCIDAHASVPGAAVSSPGRLVMVMGTSICHMTVDEELRPFDGAFGIVRSGILPGLYGYETGQPAFGDMFDWFVQNLVPAEYHDRADARGGDIHAVLAEEASRMQPGESGLVALDWWSGNRSILLDGDLSGLILGLTERTTPAQIYRALIEAAAFGTRTVVDRIVDAGITIEEVVACGGLPTRNPLIMQTFADVVGMPIEVTASDQAAARGAAMFGAVAAGSESGGYDSIADAVAALPPGDVERYEPDTSTRAAFRRLYAEYLLLHDYFGRGANDVMKRLRAMRDEAVG